MSLPRQLLVVAGHGRVDGQALVLAIEKGIVLGVPADAVNGLATVDKLGTEHTTLGPDLDLTVLAGSSKSSSLITPLDGDNGSGVCLGDGLLDSSRLRDKFESSIGAADGERLLRALGSRIPVHADSVGIDVHDLGIGLTIDVPFPDGLVVTDTEELISIGPADASDEISVLGAISLLQFEFHIRKIASEKRSACVI